jgi:hypothetical protein
MRVRPLAAALVFALVALAGCSNPFGRQYEYEEQIYLSVTGAATVVIDASIPALVALRGLPLDLSPNAQVDRERIRTIFAAAGCQNVRVGQPWTRHGRRFIQVRVAVTAVRDLAGCGPLAWSTYSFTREGGTIHYEQVVGAPTPGNPGTPRWTGDELVAFRLHVPSRILYHNVKRLEDGSNGEPTRGNILTWEQRLTDRRAGQPLDLDVRMDAESILYRTLWLFAGAFLAAVLVLVGLVWLTIRRAKRRGVAGRAA